jgi:ABC-type bacteriocin/lantibiotic exporter with double-glycine peptidase domain
MGSVCIPAARKTWSGLNINLRPSPTQQEPNLAGRRYRRQVRGSSPRALWRVRPYLRPYVPQLAAMVVASLVAIGAGLGVPLVIRRIVDGPIARGDRDALLPLALLVLVLGLAETALACMRRWIQGGAAKTGGIRASSSAGPWPTSPSSGGSWASGWCSSS